MEVPLALHVLQSPLGPLDIIHILLIISFLLFLVCLYILPSPPTNKSRSPLSLKQAAYSEKKRKERKRKETSLQLHSIQSRSPQDKRLEMTSPAPCSRSWSISEDSLKRYVQFASESCIQELLSASDSNRDTSVGTGNNTNDGWKVLTLDNGVEISKRRSGKTASFHTFRSRWLLTSVSPQQFITVANAIDAAKQWDPDLVEARYIKDLEDNLSIICLKFGDNAKPLFRNREFIVYERRETMEDGTLVVAVASLPKEIAAGLQPKQNNAIRGLLLQSGWVVEKLEGDSCMVTYVVQLDPAGWMPRCFVNRLNNRLVMIIENLKKLAQACPIDGDGDGDGDGDEVVT